MVTVGSELTGSMTRLIVTICESLAPSFPASSFSRPLMSLLRPLEPVGIEGAAAAMPGKPKLAEGGGAAKAKCDGGCWCIEEGLGACRGWLEPPL